MSRGCRGVAWPLSLALALSAASASARTARYALLIGNNRGHADDTQLRYARRDAARVRQILLDLGGFPAENTTILEERSSKEVRRALLSINERVRRSVAGGGRAMLFVYYSGHADARHLRLSGTSLAIEELKKMVSGSAATARVLVLDACRSGSVTRVKGGRPAPPFAIAIVDRLSSEGLAVITSSAASEDSQESDRLRGSFFTHYLSSALRGAGDRNRDGRVSLTEAYAYAYAHTLRETSKTLAGPQHPTYQYRIRGKGDFIITRTDYVSGYGRVVFPPRGHFFVIKGDADGPVVAEVLTEARSSRVALPAGRYFLRKRRPDLLLEGWLRVSHGKESRVRAPAMRRVAYAQLVRKGASARALAHGPQLSYVVHGEVATGQGPTSMVELAYPLSFRHLTLAPRLAYGRLTGENERLSLDQHELSLGLAAVRVFDLGRFSPFIGLVVGWTHLWQRFESSGNAPARNSHLLHFGGEGGFDAHLWRGSYLQLRAAALTFVVRQGDRRDSSLDPQLTYQLSAGVGWQL